jgi:tetratricopeptide (TPR) repeat protein
MKAAVALLAVSFAAALAAQTTLIDQGRAALARNDPETAAGLLEKAVAQNPNSAEAHYLLGSAYGTLAQRASIFKQPGLAKKTRQEFERAVQLNPNDLSARFGLLEYYMIAPGFMGGDQQKAIEQANEIKRRDSSDGHRAFAFIYSRQKKPELARKEYLDGVREEPNSPKAHYWLGISHLTNDKNYKAATDEFETSVKLDPAYMSGWFQIGHMAALSGANLQRGEEALRKYLAYTPKVNEPGLHRAHYWLGAIYERQGKKAEARQSYATSLRLNTSQRDVSEAMKRVQ